MLFVLLTISVFWLFSAEEVFCQTGQTGGSWGRLWDHYGESRTKKDSTVRASRPIRDWEVSAQSPAFSSKLANIHVRGENWSHTFVVYESSIPGVYWVARTNSNGEERWGRGGARTAFKIYGEEGIFSKHLTGDGDELNKEGWRLFCDAMSSRNPGLGALLLDGSVKSTVFDGEVITKVHPEADRPDLGVELKVIHVLRSDTLGDFEIIDVSSPNG